MLQFDSSTLDRFLAKVQFPQTDPDACWIWAGASHSKSRGYGKFRVGQKVMNAHRASYLMFNGSISDGLVVAHQCNNERCVNPAHLAAQSQSENISYAWKCGRMVPGSDVSVIGTAAELVEAVRVSAGLA